MKLLNSPKMRHLLASGKRKARRQPAPSDGMFHLLIYKTKRNGWHYQVEYVHDTRLKDKPYVIVYAFAPPRDFSARSATHYLA